MSESAKKINNLNSSKNNPLSYTQKKLWLIKELQRGRTAFIISRVFHICGPLNFYCLQKAWSAVLQDFLNLKINFKEHDGQVYQCVNEKICDGVDLREFNGMAEPAAWEKIRESLDDLFSKPFDLSTGPLFRIHLFKICEDNCVLAFCFHRLIADRTTMSTVIQALVTYYNGTLNGKELHPIRRESDYFVIVPHSLIKTDYEKTDIQSYWEKKFTDFPELINLPYDKKADCVYPERFNSLEIHFEGDIYDKIEEYCFKSSINYLDLATAVLYVLIKRYTGQQDICISVPVSGRENGFGAAAGPFEILLPVRIITEEDLSFSDILDIVKKNISEAISNQKSYDEFILENVSLRSDKSALPLYQVSLHFDSSSEKLPTINGCTCRELNEYFIYGGCELNFFLRSDENQLKGKVDYNSALFSADAVSRMVTHFSIILKSVLLNPEIKITAIDLLTDEERAAIERWNDTETDYPVEETVASLFYKQVDCTPDAVAVIQNDLRITYKELNRRVERLGNLLTENQVAPGEKIAVCMERSAESIVCMLAIIKSGAVYVPLDPKYPAERLLYIISDSEISIVLTKSRHKRILSPSGKRMLFLDENQIENTDNEERRLQQILPDDPVYIMYTSGSTGLPKGIVGKNRGLINRLFWIWDTYPFVDGEICCHKISTGFIDHLAEVFTPLLKGVPVVIFNSDNVKGVEDFCNVLIDKKISRLIMTPSSLKLLLKEKREKGLQFKSIRYVFCSGEALPVSLAEDFYTEFSSARLINIYGSSEVSADVTYYEVDKFSVKNVLHYFNRFSMNKEELQRYKKNLGHFSDYITKPDTDLYDVSKIFTNYRLFETPQNIEQYYYMLYSDVLPFIINTSSPRFIGHMTSALPDYLHDLSKLISQLNQNMVKIETSKSLTFLERESLAILHRCFYKFSDQFYEENIQKVNANLGIITTGGTTSNIGALLSARNKLLFGNCEDISSLRESIYSRMHKKGYKDMVIIGSPLMHYSMKKASSILGLGIDNIIYIEMDNNNRMDTKDLERKIIQCQKENILILAVVGIAGATETGIIDPLQEIAAITRKYGVHFHVDAAWGGALIFSGKYSHLLEGIENADSITLCGHKQLYLPQGISICLLKDPFQISYAATTARYQASPNTYDFGRFSIEGSRSALSMCLHASLRILGKKGYEALIDDGIDKARFFSEIITASSAFELIEKPQINIVNYRYIPEKYRLCDFNKELSEKDSKYINDINCKIQQKQFVKGNTFVSKTSLNRKTDDKEEVITVFRAVLSNPLTTCDDLYSVLEDQLKIAEDLLGDKNDYGRGVINRKIIIKKEEKPTDDEILTIPIGKPIHNTKIYIVDSIGNIAPIGIQGEICIAGDAVAHGYFNNEELNKKCFITNPFHKGNYHRLYRTGDLGMYLPDGSIKFLGRIDDQIKIRGRRIECGEVESILCSNAEIADAAVVGRKSEKGMELIAFYVSKHNEVVSLESLREFLKCKIPEYMIPALFIEQKRLPIMPNGKIDKKKLQQIAITQSA